jgi:hypothetical protein
MWNTRLLILPSSHTARWPGIAIALKQIPRPSKTRTGASGVYVERRTWAIRPIADLIAKRNSMHCIRRKSLYANP